MGKNECDGFFIVQMNSITESDLHRVKRVIVGVCCGCSFAGSACAGNFRTIGVYKCSYFECISMAYALTHGEGEKAAHMCDYNEHECA